MHRIAVVSSGLQKDWASRALLDAAHELADGGHVDPARLTIRMDTDLSITLGDKSAYDFDAYILRSFNRQFEVDYQYEIFELLLHAGILVVNSPAGLSVAESKSQTTFLLRNAGLPVPRTLVTQDLGEASDAVREFGASVIKPLFGSFGIGIEKIGPRNGIEMLPDFLARHGAVYIQEFVPNEGRDIRAFVVGDDIPAAMYRIAVSGQWKTNVYQGATCEPCHLTVLEREMCLEAARIIGLDYTGVDIVEGPDGPVILELNGAPSWYGLSDTTDRNIAMDIVRHVLQKLELGQPARRPIGTGDWAMGGEVSRSSSKHVSDPVPGH